MTIKQNYHSEKFKMSQALFKSNYRIALPQKKAH